MVYLLPDLDVNVRLKLEARVEGSVAHPTKIRKRSLASAAS